MATDTTSRRTILGAGLGAFVGLVATAIGRPQATSAADGDPMVSGRSSATTSTTEIVSPAADPTFAGRSESGVGVEGTSGTSRGVRGTSDSSNGVEGRSNTSSGVYGYSNSGDGVHGYSGSRNGVSGYTDSPHSDAAVFGESNHVSSYGVNGSNRLTGTIGALGGPNTGVFGLAPAGVSPNGLPFAAVAALSEGSGIALSVNGRAFFSRSGRTSLPRGRSYLDVSAPGGLLTDSLVLAVLMANRPGVYVQAVVPNTSTGKFRVYLNRVASSSSTTPVAWFIVN